MKHLLLLKRSAYGPLLLMIALLIGGCNNDDDAAPPRPSEGIVEIIRATEGLDSLAALIGQSGPGNEFANRLSSGEYTIFAPNNAAFSKLLESIGLESMSELRSSLVADIIYYHIIANKTLETSQLDSSVTTLNFEILNLSQEGDSVLINRDTQPDRTTIVSPNIAAANGVVHVINEVVLPASLRALQPDFGNILGIMSTYGYSNDLGGFINMYSIFSEAQLLPLLRGNGPFTILAPLDGFFSNFAAVNLTYEAFTNYNILEGNINLAEADRMINSRSGEQIYVTNFNGMPYLNGIATFDFGLSASNGRVLLTAGVLKPADTLPNTIMVAETLTGVSFNIFKAVLRETGIELGNNLTIFMPTDQAFEAAGFVTSIDSVSAARLDPAFLTNIIQTHVINGVNFGVDIATAGSVSTTALNNTPLTLNYVSNSGLSISSPGTSDAGVIFGDELSTNGVVHVINKVLLSEADNQP